MTTSMAMIALVAMMVQDEFLSAKIFRMPMVMDCSNGAYNVSSQYCSLKAFVPYNIEKNCPGQGA